MSVPDFLTSAYSQIFRLLSNITFPYFDITLIDIIIGLSVISLSIGLFKAFNSISKVTYSSNDSKSYKKKGVF